MLSEKTHTLSKTQSLTLQTYRTYSMLSSDLVFILKPSLNTWVFLVLLVNHCAFSLCLLMLYCKSAQSSMRNTKLQVTSDLQLKTQVRKESERRIILLPVTDYCVCPCVESEPMNIERTQIYVDGFWRTFILNTNIQLCHVINLNSDS